MTALASLPLLTRHEGQHLLEGSAGVVTGMNGEHALEHHFLAHDLLTTAQREFVAHRSGNGVGEQGPVER